jgi:hypothetical protein
MYNYITKGNFSEISEIGGDTFEEDDENIVVFLDYDITNEPKLNYYSEKEEQEVSIIFYYNDGFFNRDIFYKKTIKTIAYTDLIPGANYTKTIPDRNTDLVFSDNSSSNENRIINTDWSLTDRYEDNSMTEDKRGDDNLQIFLGVLKNEEITTKINSYENHTLSQDIIRWDNGYKEITFNNSYNIRTTKYDINPLFSYYQEFNTGPEIIFVNESSINEHAVLLSYDYEIEDKNNDGTDAYAEYRNISISELEQKHTYKSVSNSPFENDIENKNVTIFQDYDDGWNEVYDNYSMDICVKPNRISQSFILNPLRHSEDTETANNIITGNNPIEFYDNSTSERDNKSFIKKVQYIITEDC